VVEEPDPVREEAAETARQRRGHKEIADAEGDFALRVEQGEVDGEAGEEASFESPEEEAACDEGAVGVAEARERRDDAPGGCDEGDPARRTDFFDDEVRREPG
jgi:hypothetical protein